MSQAPSPSALQAELERRRREAAQLRRLIQSQQRGSDERLQTGQRLADTRAAGSDAAIVLRRLRTSAERAREPQGRDINDPAFIEAARAAGEARTAELAAQDRAQGVRDQRLIRGVQDNVEARGLGVDLSQLQNLRRLKTPITGPNPADTARVQQAAGARERFAGQADDRFERDLDLAATDVVPIPDRSNMPGPDLRRLDIARGIREGNATIDVPTRGPVPSLASFEQAVGANPPMSEVDAARQQRLLAMQRLQSVREALPVAPESNRQIPVTEQAAAEERSGLDAARLARVRTAIETPTALEQEAADLRRLRVAQIRGAGAQQGFVEPEEAETFVTGMLGDLTESGGGVAAGGGEGFVLNPDTEEGQQAISASEGLTARMERVLSLPPDQARAVAQTLRRSDPVSTNPQNIERTKANIIQSLNDQLNDARRKYAPLRPAPLVSGLGLASHATTRFADTEKINATRARKLEAERDRISAIIERTTAHYDRLIQAARTIESLAASGTDAGQ